MLLDALLVAVLSVAPTEGAAETPAPSVEGPADGQAEYQAALERVTKAKQMANEEPRRGAVQLRDALQLLRDFGPTLARDPEGQDLRTMALLTLSRSLLATEDADGAREAMDEAIRTARGDPIPSDEFGPGLAALFKERTSVLGKLGEGSIAVECNTPCSIYINERPTQPVTEGLVPGRYRLWITARDGSEADLVRDIEVEADKAATVEFGQVIEDVQPPPPDKKKRDRIMPRWAEGLLIGAGIGAMATGAVLWAIDLRCPPGTGGYYTCPEVYYTKTAGIITLAAGGAVLLGGTITLSVDEVRAKKRRGAEAMLTWRVNF